MSARITHLIRGFARRVVPASRGDLDRLRAEIEELRADNNELRADNLRIAQLHDIVVDRLAKLPDASTEK